MIQSISILTAKGKDKVVLNNLNNKVIIEIKDSIINEFNSFDIEIVFSHPITGFRNHDYTWIKCDSNSIANTFSPKIIQLSIGEFVQANNSIGIWEINKSKKNVLLWRFNPKNASPLTEYQGLKNQKFIEHANQKIKFPEFPALLFAKKTLEISRSKIPFSAIAVFTDHCDFDTLENLKLQREFFNSNGIKVTKGIFLNHFSKRGYNASVQNDKEELLKWKEEGHELCYHSLSQSIKSDEESVKDFRDFQPPFSDISTWIDHGYQPYNFSLFQNNSISKNNFENNLIKKNITTLWNYIDSGTATVGVINQLNSNQFTLHSFFKGNKDLPFVKRMQLIIKNIIFHYYGDEQLILKYKSTATNFKKVISKKKISYVLLLIKNLFQISAKLIIVFLFWNTNKKKPYKLAKYSPILFKHQISEKEFYVFQTVEMLDFNKALSSKNIDCLIKEKGVFIAHTYFSVPMYYHQGKMFSNGNTIGVNVAENFKNLGNKIKNKEIWNPTLQELVAYWSNFENLLLDIDNQGNVFVKNKTELLFRTVI